MINLSVTVWLRISIVIVTLYCLNQITSIYLPIVLAIILSFILNPLVGLLQRIKIRPLKNGLSRAPAILVTFFLAFSMLGLTITFILLPFVEEFNLLISNLPNYIEKIKNISIMLGSTAHSQYIPENIRGVFDQALSEATAFSVNLAKRMLNAILAFASQIVELVVVPVLTYYLLKDWEVLRDDFISLVSEPYRPQIRQIIREMAAVVSGYIRGQVVVSVIIGLMVFSGTYIFGIDYPLVLGLLATLTETIPIIGPIVGAAPAVLLAYIISPALAIKVMLFYVFVQQLENHIIVPKVMGHSIDLHPIAIIISLLIGGHLFGLAGMILAVPTAALLKVLIKHIWYYGER